MINQRPKAITTAVSEDDIDHVSVRPVRVSHAVLFLWGSIALSTVGFSINVWRIEPSAAPLGWVLGALVLCVKALIVRFIGAGSNAARILLLVILVLGIPGLVTISSRLLVDFGASVLITLVSMVLQISAVYLVFTGESRVWFKAAKGA